MLEKGLPRGVVVLQLLHGEDEVGDNEHKHNEVEGERVPGAAQPHLHPQEPRLPRGLGATPRREGGEARC